MTFLRLLLVLLACAGAAVASPAPPMGPPVPAPHAFNQSYIYLRIAESDVEGRFEINIEDVNRALGTTFSKAIDVTEEDIQPELQRIEDYVYGRIGFAIDGQALEIERQGFDLSASAGRQYVRLKYKLGGVEGLPEKIDITHNVLFDVDSQHRGFVVIEQFFHQGTFDNEGNVSLIFSPGDTQQTLDLTDTSIWAGIRALVKSGIHHILIGIDHILFLLVLLLPAVLRREGARWAPQEKFSTSLWQVLKIVTVFTIAHSITLSIAALGLLQLPARAVESVIAISIAVAALDILFPIFRGRILLVVLGFGFFHGFGFANVLGDLGISGADMAMSLLGFNVGVELGQIGIVLAVFPMLFMMRLSLLYTRFTVYAGALLCMFISIYWFIERAFDKDLTLGEYLGPLLSFL